MLVAPAPGSASTGFMTPIPPSQASEKNPMSPCKHPRVQIVARDEDAEFVECLECREVFESSEFKDMSLEEMSEETNQSPES
jgi:hypothetical protein